MKLSIGEVSKLCGITPDTLRHYDKIGLLRPDVNESNGYRYYSYEHLDLLSLILWTKDLGISLGEIREFIDRENIDEYSNLITHQQNLLKEKFKALKVIEEKLNATKETLDEIKDFNDSDIDKNINLSEAKFTFYGISIKNVIENNSYREYVNKAQHNVTDLKDGGVYYQCNFKKGKMVFKDDSYIFIKGTPENEEIVREYFINKGYETIKREVQGKVAWLNFYGNEEELDDYINKSINELTSRGKVLSEDFYINYILCLPSKNGASKYYVEVMFILK
ncbi:MerR family transcriptional regulator [Clostridium sp.]|uniref:MerR family transcriptional regulator n=1 Tax=Clostridium sp. TaxID=1506 RepID=UPI003FA5C7AA